MRKNVILRKKLAGFDKDRKERYTFAVTVPGWVVKALGWKVGTELQPLVSGEDVLVLKRVKK